MKIVAVGVAVAVMATPAIARCSKGQNVSWYGEPQRLPDGSRFDPNAETCAHRTAPFGTVLRVEDLDTGLGADCAVNDRGPNKWTRCDLDVSRRVAELLGMKGRGMIRARITVRPAEPRRFAETENPGRSSPGPHKIDGAPLF